MRLAALSRRHLLVIAYILGLVLALLIAWLVRDQPLAPDALGRLVRLDALGAFFALLTLAGAALATADGASPLRTALACITLLVSYATSHLLIVGLGYLLATLLVMEQPMPARRNLLSTLSNLIAPICLLLAYGAIWLNGGAWRYDLPTTGASLDSGVFWFVLLAVVLGGNPLLRSLIDASVRARWPRFWQPQQHNRETSTTTRAIWALPWLYPLLRLYSLGPWNSGWSLATLLLGSALAVWCAARGAAEERIGDRSDWVIASIGGLALAGAGLSSAAGVATCCYSLLCALLLVLGLKTDLQPASTWSSSLLWALCGALPITVPFVAVWLGIGAATAGGVLLVAGAFWLAGLGNTLAVLRLQDGGRGMEDRGPRTNTETKDEGRRTNTEVISSSPVPRLPSPVSSPPSFRRVAAAILSLLGGVLAPLVIQWPIIPVARQLQGGLTPFGDLTIWPWVGLAALDSARQPVASLPSLAIGGLMLVLSAMAWLVVRLVRSRR